MHRFLTVCAVLFLLTPLCADAQALRLRAGGGLAFHLDRTDNNNQSFSPAVEQEYLSVNDLYRTTGGRLDVDLGLTGRYKQVGLRGGLAYGWSRAGGAEDGVNLAFGETLTYQHLLGYGEVARRAEGPTPFGHLAVGMRWYRGSTTQNGVDATFEFESAPMIRLGAGYEFPVSKAAPVDVGILGFIEYTATERARIVATRNGRTDSEPVSDPETLYDPSVNVMVYMAYSLGL